MKNHDLRKYTLFAGVCVILLSCSDYESGYNDGYKGQTARKWLLKGRHQYTQGHTEGRMQAFHDDWYAENADEMDAGLSCPVPVMRPAPVLVRAGGMLVEAN